MQKDKNFSVCVMIVLLIVLGIAAVIVLPPKDTGLSAEPETERSQSDSL